MKWFLWLLLLSLVCLLVVFFLRDIFSYIVAVLNNKKTKRHKYPHVCFVWCVRVVEVVKVLFMLGGGLAGGACERLKDLGRSRLELRENR